MSSFYTMRRVIRFGGVVALLMLMAPASFAGRSDQPTQATISGELQAYTPPSNGRRPRRSHTGGSVRGCGDDIVAIAPRFTSVGQTASTNPTFVWYNFSPDNDPIEFQLYRLHPDDSFEEIKREQFETSQQGYMTYTLHAEEASLSVGDTYVWQVVLYCDNEFKNPGHYSSAELEVVALPAEITSALTASPSQRAEVYANASLWYEAMAEVAIDSSPTTGMVRQSLILDLANLEEQSTEENAKVLSDQLRQIVGLE